MQSSDKVPNFRVSYVPERKPELEFEICPMTSDRIEEINKTGAWVFCNFEAFFSSMNTSQEDMNVIFDMLGKSCLKSGLGLVCYEKKTGDIAAVIYNGDMSEHASLDDLIKLFRSQGRHKLADIYVLLKDIVEAGEKACPEAYEAPEKYGEGLHLIIAACMPKYQGLGIITRMVEFMLNEHPLIKNYKHIVTEAFSIGSKIAFERNGFKTVNTLLFKEFEKDGKRPLAHIEESMKSRGLRPSDGSRCMVFDRK